MTSREFCYWLQGYFEIKNTVQGNVSLDPDQVIIIQKHLALVFRHEIDPSYPNQDELYDIHSSYKKVNSSQDLKPKC